MRINNKCIAVNISSTRSQLNNRNITVDFNGTNINRSLDELMEVPVFRILLSLQKRLPNTVAIKTGKLNEEKFRNNINTSLASVASDSIAKHFSPDTVFRYDERRLNVGECFYPIGQDIYDKNKRNPAAHFCHDDPMESIWVSTTANPQRYLEKCKLSQAIEGGYLYALSYQPNMVAAAKFFLDRTYHIGKFDSERNEISGSSKEYVAKETLELSCGDLLHSTLAFLELELAMPTKAGPITDIYRIEAASLKGVFLRHIPSNPPLMDATKWRPWQAKIHEMHMCKPSKFIAAAMTEIDSLNAHQTKETVFPARFTQRWMRSIVLSLKDVIASIKNSPLIFLTKRIPV